jgi:hypothetical protein
MMRGTSYILAIAAASRDLFQVQRGFLASPVALERSGYDASASALSGVDLETAYIGSFADLAPVAPAEVSSAYYVNDDHMSTACIVAMFAILGYTFQRMNARQPLGVPPAADEAAVRLAGTLPSFGAVTPGKTAMLAVGGYQTSLATVALDPAAVLKAELLAECADGLGGRPDRARVAELLLALEAKNKTKSPAQSALLNGRWKFLYASGASPALQALQLMLKGAEAIPRAPFGPTPVDIDDTYLTINAQRYATASTKVRMMDALETTMKLQSKLEAESPVRLIETYESAGSESSTPAGLLPVQLPALPYKRSVLVAYLDETMLIVRDAAGRPDLLTRVAGDVDATNLDADDDTLRIPEVITEAEEKIGEAVEAVETKVEEMAGDVVDDVVDAVHAGERLAFVAAEATDEALKENADFFTEVAAASAAAEENYARSLRNGFFSEAEAMKERADFFAEAAAVEEKRADADAEQAVAKKKRGLFSFLRRKERKAAAEISKVSAPLVETAKKTEAEAKIEEEELREHAIQIRAALRQRLREEKAKASELAARTEDKIKELPADAAASDSFSWDQWLEYVQESEGTTSLDQWREFVQESEGATAATLSSLDKVGFETYKKAAEEAKKVEKEVKKMEMKVEKAEKKVEKAIKKRGPFGFLKRKKGKEDGKTKAKKPAKKGRAAAKAANGRAAKKGLFGFLRRKNAVEGDDAGTA